MKLLMTTDTIGGVWTYCMELCAALAPHGVSIALASMGRKLSAEQRRQIEALPHVRLHEREYRLCWMKDAWGDVAEAGNWLLQLEQEFQPDLVHLNDLGHGGLAWRSPVLLIAHSCVFSWWDQVKNQQAPAKEWQRYKETVRKSVQRADLVAAPSQAMLDIFLRYYGPARAATVLANGMDFPPLAPSPLKAPLPKEPVVFAAGRLWDEAKNVATLAAAAPKIAWPVHVAGDQSGPDGHLTQIEGVNCLGVLSRDEIASWLGRASIYVAPARYEPFGLAILEAARSGCALVLGNIASLREVWGEAAVYVGADDPQQLTRAVSSLIDSPGRRQHLAERAWQKAQQYTGARMASGYFDCYQKLLSEPRQAAAPEPAAAPKKRTKSADKPVKGSRI